MIFLSLYIVLGHDTLGVTTSSTTTGPTTTGTRTERVTHPGAEEQTLSSYALSEERPTVRTLHEGEYTPEAEADRPVSHEVHAPHETHARHETHEVAEPVHITL